MDADRALYGDDPRHEAEYWSFQGRAERKFAHGFLQYPAMMVPQMQGELIDLVRAQDPNIEHVWDPFVGAGTILAEVMLRGLRFTGNDINPLAVLVSQTKRGPFHVRATEEKLRTLFERIKADQAPNTDVDFAGRDKWFSPTAVAALCKIRRAIRSEPALWARRFFWVAMAECVRLTSNSRTSTYKLHIRPDLDQRRTREDVMQVFEKIIEKNFLHLQNFRGYLEHQGFLKNGYYKNRIDVALADTANLQPKFIKSKDVDLIITSPPYGDNRTTVPYGQYSYLPLSWIDLADIDTKADKSILNSTNTIDSQSLGGSARFHSHKSEQLCSKYSKYFELEGRLQSKSTDARKKVASFFYDFDSCIDPLLDRLKDNGLMVWTIGNRTVANTQIPFDSIFRQMMQSRGVKIIKEINRKIPSKRMAKKNNITETMTSELIIILRKT